MLTWGEKHFKPLNHVLKWRVKIIGTLLSDWITFYFMAVGRKARCSVVIWWWQMIWSWTERSQMVKEIKRANVQTGTCFKTHWSLMSDSQLQHHMAKIQSCCMLLSGYLNPKKAPSRQKEAPDKHMLMSLWSCRHETQFISVYNSDPRHKSRGFNVKGFINKGKKYMSDL